MKKILVGFLIDGKCGGVDRYLMNFLQIVAGPELQIDFLTNRVDEDLKNRLAAYGSELYEIPSLMHPLRQYHAIADLIRKNHYDITYFNISTAVHLMGPMAAYRCGVKKRILHSHSSGVDGESSARRRLFTALHQLCKGRLARYGTDFLACSKKAGEWLYPQSVVSSEQFHVIYNAVDLNRFHYDEGIRSQVRAELGLEGKLVLGHIGSFSYVKNHGFLLDVFDELMKKEPNAVLLLAGTGPNFDAVCQKAKELGIEENVLFLGYRNDADRLMQAMDFFVMPSYFEGFPIVCVEAQAEQLGCILSDSITDEVSLTESCYFLSLADTPQKWADFILSHRDYDRRQNKITQDLSFCEPEQQELAYRTIIE